MVTCMGCRAHMPSVPSKYSHGWSCKCGRMSFPATDFSKPLRVVRTNLDALADHYHLIVGEEKGHNLDGDEVITLYLVRLKTGFVLRSLDGELKTPIDCSYPKPPAFEGQEFRSIGNSGIASRNNWSIELPTVKYRAVVYEVDEYVPTDDVTYELTITSLPEPKEDEFEFYEADTLRRYNEFIKDYMFKASLAEAPKVTGFMEIKEANKDKWYDFIEYLDGKDFLVLNKYVTTRGNVTLLLHPVSDVLKVPDGYKGIVIGKGGSNIKALCQRYGRKFKVV